jgi:AcrR family transcriptional regulator
VARGRPREFDIDKALDQALLVFWKKGYEGASLPDLTKAMGISRPSLYAAFGNKEALFQKALDRYGEGPAAYFRQALEEPHARDAVERLLNGAVDLLTHPRHPRGCLIVQGALSGNETCDAVRKALAARRMAGQQAIRERLERARAEGDLPDEVSPADLARFLAAVIHGMAVQAAGGADRKSLRSIARTAMRTWPE